LKQDDKPNGAGAGWKLIEMRRCFENEVCALRNDRLEVKGEELEYAYVERAEAVIIVPVTSAGEIVLLKQYRYPVDEWCLEVPAGGTHDTDVATLEEVARKELREEIGATAEKLTYVTFFYTANAFSNEKCHVFLAEAVKLSKEPKREESESIKTQLLPASEVIELARRGEMKTAPCALAVLLCEPLLKEQQLVAEIAE
jgi:ADP-ribose pyrophosphatase